MCDKTASPVVVNCMEKKIRYKITNRLSIIVISPSVTGILNKNTLYSNCILN